MMLQAISARIALSSQRLLNPRCLSNRHLMTRRAIYTRPYWVVNPSPYMIYLQGRGSIIIASSPEILCRTAGP